MFSLDSLSTQARHNLPWEALQEVFRGLAGGCVLSLVLVVLTSLDPNPESPNRWVAMVVVSALPGSQMFMPFWTLAARRWKLQSLVVIGHMLRSVPLLGMAFVNDQWTCVAVVWAIYLVSGPLIVGIPTLYHYNYHIDQRARIIGSLSTVRLLASMTMMGGFAWGLELDPQAYRWMCPIAGVCAMLAAVCFAKMHIPNDSPASRARESRSAGPPWKEIIDVLGFDRAFRLFQIIGLLTGAGFLMTRPLLFTELSRIFQFGPFELQLCVNLLPQIVGCITAPLWGFMVDRRDPILVRVLFSVICCLCFLSLWGGIVFTSVALIWTMSLLRGLAEGGGPLTRQSTDILFAVIPERTVLYSSITSMMIGVRGLVFPVCGVALFSMVLGNAIFPLALSLNVVSTALCVKLMKLVREQPPQHKYAVLQRARRLKSQQAECHEELTTEVS